jgi:hypothetical protein
MNFPLARIPLWLLWLPFSVFLVVYLITCVVAAVPLAFGYAPLRTLVEYFAGVSPPSGFSAAKAVSFWALLLAAPALMALGYGLVLRQINLRGNVYVSAADRGDAAWQLGRIAVVVSAGFSIYSLLRAGAFANASRWWDYGAWVRARWELFKTLGYFEFVNLYTWLPVALAWMTVSTSIRNRRQLWQTGCAILIVIGIVSLLYQKKAMVETLLLVLFSVMLERSLRGQWTRCITRSITATLAVLVILYLIMTVLPVWRDTTSHLEDAKQSLPVQTEQMSSNAEAPAHRHSKQVSIHESTPAQESPKQQEPLRQQESTQTQESTSAHESPRNDGPTPVQRLQELIGAGRPAHVAAYALLSPFTRTSLPTLYYAEVFPQQHPFFGLDLGQDILGYGSMPNDNYVIWKAMYPRLPGGAVAAPFHFVLYSQIGLAGALLMALLVGTAYAVVWTRLLAWREPGVIRFVMGAIFLLMAVYLAIDSLRNSFVASYGLIWAMLFAGILYGASVFFGGRLRLSQAMSR